jgi:hypothetical protein
MSKEVFPYDQWVNEALSSVLARALKLLEEGGPIDHHHFFINFNTRHKGVKIPDFLITQYPNEMTIVLQNQFENLVVNDHEFQVSLSFNGKKTRLTIPFSAVTSFADPSVNFGLQIAIPSINKATMETEPDFDTADLHKIEKSAASIKPISLITENPATQENRKANNIQTEKVKTTAENKLNNKQQTAKVIALDTFRKK